MAFGNQSAQSLPESRIRSRNTLIAKIALLLNYISKDTYKCLLAQVEQTAGSTEAGTDILRLMLKNKLVSASEHFSLKKACTAFAKIHEDSRFGALCLEFNFLTEGNLKLALEEQQALADNGQHVQLGDLLVDAGMISESQKQLVLQKQRLNASVKPKPEDPAIDTSHMREIQEHFLVYYIQNDGLKAYVRKRSAFDPAMVSPEDLKESVSRNGVIYGLVDDSGLQAFLESDRYKTRLFELATGLPPVHGKDARIEYRFDQDYLKPGHLKEDGSIDFKERGEIPFVRQGDLLAEKIPPEHGKEGVNVFGDTVMFAEARDLSIRCGKNVRLSADERHAFSEVEGNPKIDENGILSVNSAYFIEGDVDYNTGHVKFDKNVYITGTVKSGFRVEAIDVVANAVDGGIINAQGDILIKNGITEAEIMSNGSINATYIHRSRIACLRDLKVIREIVDTEARMDGMCLLKNGRVSSSQLSAKGGAVIKNIGSQKSKPSVIEVGTSLYAEKQLRRIDELIERNQNMLDMFTLEQVKIEKDLSLINETLENLMASRKRTQAMVDELKRRNSLASITPFQNSLIKATEKIETLSMKRAILIKQKTRTANEVIRASERVNSSVQEKFKLRRLEQNTPARAVLDIGGTVFSGTRVQGKYSHMILKETRNRIRIMESSRTTEDNAKKSWEMVVLSL